MVRITLRCVEVMQSERNFFTEGKIYTIEKIDSESKWCWGMADDKTTKSGLIHEKWWFKDDPLEYLCLFIDSEFKVINDERGNR